MTEIPTALIARLDAIEASLHAKLDAGLLALHHLLTRTPNMDHKELLALATTVDGKVDTAVANFQSFEATHAAVVESLSDVGDILNGIPAKLAKIVGPAASGSGGSTPTTLTVAAPTTAPATVLTVTGDAPPAGSGIAGAGIADGTTVSTASPGPIAGQSTIMLDVPTTADHVGDGSETLTVMSTAS